MCIRLGMRVQVNVSLPKSIYAEKRRHVCTLIQELFFLYIILYLIPHELYSYIYKELRVFI